MVHGKKNECTCLSIVLSCSYVILFSFKPLNVCRCLFNQGCPVDFRDWVYLSCLLQVFLCSIQVLHVNQCKSANKKGISNTWMLIPHLHGPDSTYVLHQIMLLRTICCCSVNQV